MRRVHALATAVMLALASVASAGEPPADAVENILAVRLDGREVIGSTLLKQSADGSDVWLELDDWKKMDGITLDLSGKSGQVSASELGLKVTFDEAAQAIDIQVPSVKRPAQVIGRGLVSDLSKPDKQPRGVFLNYDIAARQSQGNLNLSLGHEARIGVGPATLQSWGQLNRTGNGMDYIRSMTTLKWDDLDRRLAWQVGDVLTPAVPGGGFVNLGGIKVGTDRGLARDRVWQAVPVFAGVAETRSSAEIFVNGQKTGQGNLSEGPWSTRDMATRNGANDVRVVIRDEFGREQVLSDRFYFSGRNLPKGAQEWEVTAGLIRDTANRDRYATPAAAARIERGISNQVTLGTTIEATKDAQALGASARIALNNFGAASLDLIGSRSERGTGHGAIASWDYTERNWSVNAGHSRFSDDFWQLNRAQASGSQADAFLLRSQTALGASLNPLGKPWSVSVGAARLEYQSGKTSQRIDTTARYRTKDWDMSAGIARTTDGNQWHASVGRAIGRDTRFYANARQAPQLSTDVTLNGLTRVRDQELRYSAGVGRTSGDTSAWLQGSTETRLGFANAEYRQGGGQREITAQFRGSVWAGEGGVTFQRESNAGFLLVDVANQKGIAVSGPGAVVHTNRFGTAVIPNSQAFYPQTVSIDPTNVDIATAFETTEKTGTAGRIGGAKVSFEQTSSSMVELRVMKDGKPMTPPALISSDTDRGPMGEGGAAVLMDPQPNQTITATVPGEGACRFTLPAKLPAFTDILEVDCK